MHAGGRGKAGGVKLARDVAAVRAAAAEMLGQRLVTKQTGAEGLPIERVYVESGSEIARELYLSLTLNRERGRIAVIASAAGGMDIEEVAHKTPEKILSVNGASGRRAAALPVRAARLRPGAQGQADRRSSSRSLLALYQLYMEQDASLSRSIR